MAEYGYARRGYAHQEKTRLGTKTPAWNNGVEAYPDGRTRTSEEYEDQFCSITIDAEGIRVISYTPNQNSQNFVTKTETIIERIYEPVEIRYGTGAPTKLPQTKDYEVVNGGWIKPAPPSAVEIQYQPGYHTKPAPKKDYKVVDGGWIKPTPPSPVEIRYPPSSHTKPAPKKEYEVVDGGWSKPAPPSPVEIQYQKGSHTKPAPKKDYEVVNGGWGEPENSPVEIQYQKGSPTKPAPKKDYEIVNGVWGKPENSPGDIRYQTGSPAKPAPTKDYEIVNGGGWGKPAIPSYDRPPKVDEFVDKVLTEVNPPSKPNVVSSPHRRQTPNSNTHGGYYETDTPHFDVPVTKPKKSPPVTTTASQPRWTVPPSVVPRVNTMTPMWAARRYGGVYVQTAEDYTPTIDSVEVLRRYGGKQV